MTTEVLIAVGAGLFQGLLVLGLVRLAFRFIQPSPRTRERTLRLALLLPIIVGARAYLTVPEWEARVEEMESILAQEDALIAGVDDLIPGLARREGFSRAMSATRGEEVVGQIRTVRLIAAAPHLAATEAGREYASDSEDSWVGSAPPLLERVERSVEVRTGWPTSVVALLWTAGFLWGLGIVRGGTRLGVGIRRLSALLADSVPAPQLIQREAVDEANALGLKGIDVRMAAGLSSPFVAGLATLVLPDWFSEMAPAERRAVLAHEMAHLKRRDPIRQLGTAALQVLLWPVPMLDWALSQLRVAVEHRCDDWAIQRMGGGRSLAQALASVAERVHAKREVDLPLGAFISGAPLAERVGRALSGPSPEARWGGRMVLAAIIGLTLWMPPVRPPGEFSMTVSESRGWVAGSAETMREAMEAEARGIGPHARMVLQEVETDR